MKKSLKIIFIMLIILIVIAGVLFYIINKKQFSTSLSNNKEENTYEDVPANYVEHPEYDEFNLLNPLKFDEAMESYNGKMSELDIKRALYQLVEHYIPTISENTANLSDTEIEAYYDFNLQSINKMHINSKQDFTQIAETIKDAKLENGDIPKATVDSYENQKEYYTFLLHLEYTNSRNIVIRVNISNTEESIQYRGYNELDKIYDLYKGDITEKEIQQYIYALVNNARNLYESTKKLSINGMMQYYDLNTAELNSLGIYSKEDCLYIITNALFKISWPKAPSFIGYTVDETSFKEDNDYSSFDTLLNYSTLESMKVKIYVANSSQNNIKFKITAIK